MIMRKKEATVNMTGNRRNCVETKLHGSSNLLVVGLARISLSFRLSL